MSRFEVNAAWIAGFAFPIVETLRRRTDFSDPPAYVDDFLWGGVLLWAAWATPRRGYGSGLLAGAWGIVCGAMYYSFFGQISDARVRDISGLPNLAVVLIKGGMLAFAILCLALSVRRFRAPPPARME